MCGIVGILALTDHPNTVCAKQLIEMRDTMVHRGPDGEGLWIDEEGRVGLAHRRLAIIEPTACANQPMASVDGRFRIVFNGEIYNHADLRRELIVLGRTHWNTDHSDTEVILQAFAEWGIECVHRFRGMFAFALWDSEQRALWLVRDRIGVKPLYYSVRDGRLTFASEIKAILADPMQPREVNERALYHYLTFLCTPAPMTLFKGIEKLSPATWMRIGADGTIVRRKYWDVWDYTHPLTEKSEDEIADGLLESLRDAVTSRKVSDVPVGVFLSGGIDSSANAVLFSEGASDAVRTFSIGYKGTYASYTNETDHARRIAESVGADHHEQLLDLEDLIKFLPEMVHHQDEPIADPVCIPLYYVSKLARDAGVVVCQVGEGADELFVGYPGWLRQLTVDRWARRWLRKPLSTAVRAVLGLWPWKGGSRFEYLRRAANDQPIFWGGATAFSESEKQKLLSRPVRRRLRGVSSFEIVEPIWSRFKQSAWETTPINWMAYMDINLRLPELLLMRVDKMSMAASLEARVPFLDHNFVAYALSIPSRVRFRDGVPKAILKRAMRELLPNDVLTRRKQGFGIPIAEWFNMRLKNDAEKVIRQFAQDSGLVDASAIEAILSRGDSARIWCLYNLAAWWLHHFGTEVAKA